MHLKDKIPWGVSLPHRAAGPVDPAEVRAVAQRAEELGFHDLWVTENTLNSAKPHVLTLDPMVVLTYAAAVTTRIRLGVAVMVLPVHSPIHVAHQAASLDYLSSGRFLLGVGVGRDFNYTEFQIPMERRLRRFLEGVHVMRALWSDARVDFHGEFFHLEGASMAPKPVQHLLPVWFGGTHPDALRRAVAVADGWMGSGDQSTAAFADSVRVLREALHDAGRDPATYPISKRVFVAVDDDAKVARTEVHRWFSDVYLKPDRTDTSGIHGTPNQVRERLEELIEMGANHLLVNIVSRYPHQLEALGIVLGLQ